MGYVVFSAFDGMSCGQIAFKEIGIKVDKYYASEVDKYAIMQTQHNFPNTIQLGSIVDVDVSKLDPIDILIGGSPCQSFSFAGKRNGMTTVENEEIYTLERYLELKSEGFQFEGQSYLFWEYMRILTDIKKYNPDVKFLLENVEMGDKWERVLSESIGIFGVHINSALVSAQNRKRIYWTNIRVKEVGLFGELHSDIPQPKDEGILLKDILEEEVDEKYYLSKKLINFFQNNTLKMKEKGNGFSFKPTEGNKKANSVTTKCGSRMDDDFICVAMRGRNPNNPSDRTSGSPTEQRLEPNLNGKTNTITTVQKDNLICIKQLPRGANKGGLFHDKCPTLTSNSFEHNNHVLQINKRQKTNLKDVNGKADAFLSTSWKGSQANGMTLINSINKHNEKRENKRRSCEILLALREEINSKKNVEREMAVYARFFKDEVLFKRMYEKFISESEVRSENDKEWEKPSSKNVTNCNVLNMQFENWYRCSSQRQKSIKQFIRQLAACMSELSQQNTSSKESMHYLWKTTKRVWVLRKALSEIQKIWEPICSKTKPVQQSVRIRRLTPTEASRLQTIPEWYEWVVSETQRYKMLGNGWTVKVIMHILKYLS